MYESIVSPGLEVVGSILLAYPDCSLTMLHHLQLDHTTRQADVAVTSRFEMECPPSIGTIKLAMHIIRGLGRSLTPPLC